MPAGELAITVTATGVLAATAPPLALTSPTVRGGDAAPAVIATAGDWKASMPADVAAVAKAVVLFGVPSPVGPSYCAVAVHRYEPPQLPLLPLVMSKSVAEFA